MFTGNKTLINCGFNEECRLTIRQHDRTPWYTIVLSVFYFVIFDNILTVLPRYSNFYKTVIHSS